jgi:hypothetical protein
MYLAVSSRFLISFVVGKEQPEQGDKFLYAPAPPPPTVWALKPPSQALVHKTYRLDAISQGPKNSRFPGPTPSTCPCYGYAHIQNIMHGAV